MDGFKRRLSESLQFRLAAALLATIVVVAAIAGAFAFTSSFQEAHDLQDDMLGQIAALLDTQPGALARAASGAHVRINDEDARVSIQTLGAPPADAPGARPALTLPPDLTEGLHTLEVGETSYRVLVKRLPSGERVAVAQSTAVRDEIARDSALRTLLPLVVLVLVLLLLVASLVRRMFEPITALSRDVDQRTAQALHPLDEGRLPVEVRAFGGAINRLLGRVDQAMAAQRRFVADAAHELRSPLTALSLQAERLAEAPMSDMAKERLLTLRHGIERGRQLLEQLLTLARAQSGATTHGAPVSARAVLRRVLEDLMPLAQAKQIDLGLEGEDDAQLDASETDLLTIVRNLVDNAIRYTPANGRIDVSVRVAPGQAILCVEDTGPGIPPEERERVFEPFVRLLGTEQIGSGLGLAIVRTVADRIGAEISLAYADEAGHSGLRAQLHVPLHQSC